MLERPPSPSLFAALMRHRLAWPAVTLLLLLAINTAFNASFLHIEWRDGHLYGSLKIGRASCRERV